MVQLCLSLIVLYFLLCSVNNIYIYYIKVCVYFLTFRQSCTQLVRSQDLRLGRVVVEVCNSMPGSRIFQVLMSSFGEDTKKNKHVSNNCPLCKSQPVPTFRFNSTPNQAKGGK